MSGTMCIFCCFHILCISSIIIIIIIIIVTIILILYENDIVIYKQIHFEDEIIRGNKSPGYSAKEQRRRGREVYFD